MKDLIITINEVKCVFWVLQFKPNGRVYYRCNDQFLNNILTTVNLEPYVDLYRLRTGNFAAWHPSLPKNQWMTICSSTVSDTAQEAITKLACYLNNSIT